MNSEALIDAAMIAVEWEARLHHETIEPDTLASVRFDLGDARRYRDALYQLNSDYGIDVEIPMELMKMLHEHERQALKAVA